MTEHLCVLIYIRPNGTVKLVYVLQQVYFWPFRMVLLLWTFFVFAFCVVCLLQPCGHLSGNNWPLGSLICDVFWCTSFVDHLCFLCLVFVILSRLFIVPLWSPAWKGLTSWLSFMMLNCFLCHFPGVILGQMWYSIVSIPDVCLLSKWYNVWF